MEITVEAVQLPVYWVKQKDSRKGFTYDHVKGQGSTNRTVRHSDRPESELQTVLGWQIEVSALIPVKEIRDNVAKLKKSYYRKCPE